MASKVKNSRTETRVKPQEAPEAPSPVEAADPCGICGEPLDKDNRALCHGCGRVFHLKWDMRANVQDCGIATLDDVSCGLLFVCSSCALQKGLEWKLAPDTRRP